MAHRVVGRSSAFGELRLWDEGHTNTRLRSTRLQIGLAPRIPNACPNPAQKFLARGRRGIQAGAALCEGGRRRCIAAM